VGQSTAYLFWIRNTRSNDSKNHLDYVLYLKKKKKKNNNPSYLVIIALGKLGKSVPHLVLYSVPQCEPMKNLDEVECLHCGHIGLTSHNHCRSCFGDHKIEIEP
jgi:hypothetical protein